MTATPTFQPTGWLAKLTDPTWLVAHGTAAVFIAMTAVAFFDPSLATLTSTAQAVAVAVLPLVAVLVLVGYYIIECVRDKTGRVELEADVRAEWSTVKADVGNAKAGLVKLSGQIPQVGKFVNGLDSRVTAVETRVAGAEQAISAQPTSEAILAQAGDAAISALEDRLAALKPAPKAAPVKAATKVAPAPAKAPAAAKAAAAPAKAAAAPAVAKAVTAKA